MKAPVKYIQCKIYRNKPLSRYCSFTNCYIEQNLNSVGILANSNDIYNCEFHIYGNPTGIAISSSSKFNFNLIGNLFVFENINTNNYLMKSSSFKGTIFNNTILGAKTNKLWAGNSEPDTCLNNNIVTI
jgi:hypothetical protein